jgi:hypothetical protein
MTLLGLDLGGSHAACSLISGTSVLATEHLSFADSSSFSAVKAEVTACLRKLARRSAEPVTGLGIGLCALVDSSCNRVLSTNDKSDDSVAFDFEGWAHESLGVQVRLENDARLALRGEMYGGAARGVPDVVMFTLGTGIGGVAAMGGRPLIGAHGQAGVLGGHVAVREHGRRCNCGGEGCAEAEAGGWSLPAICREWPGFPQSRLADQPLNFPADEYVNQFPARKHDHFLIPAGTVHCSGKDSMVLEISATPYIFTFKLWDWGRVGLDGRPIHIQHAVRNIQWDRTTNWVRSNLINQFVLIASGHGWREERTGLHELEFIETRRHWFTGTVPHNTNGTVHVLSLVKGEEAIVESPQGAFEPFVVHYAETFIVPAQVGMYTIRPHGPSVGKKCGTMLAYVREEEQ